MFFDNEEKIAQIQLIRSPFIGAVMFKKIMCSYGTAKKAIPHIVNIMAAKKDFKLYSECDAKAELESSEEQNIKMVFWKDTFYPKVMENISSSAPILFVKSLNLNALKDINGIGVVGTRNSSIVAEKFCVELTSNLANDNFTIISGMAQGIDTSAHRGSLQSASNFPTVAILAGGVDQIYPSKNRFLYDEIIQRRGAIISEMPMKTQSANHLFPIRNRIIASMSRGVVVVEAKEKSGSLITAEYAKQMGKVVMAVPGFPNDVRAGGPNFLLKNGAVLVENSDDVKKALINIKQEQNLSFNFETSEYIFQDNEKNIIDIKVIILTKLSKTPVHLEELVENLGIEAVIVFRALLELELEDKITCTSANYISLI